MNTITGSQGFSQTYYLNRTNKTASEKNSQETNAESALPPALLQAINAAIEPDSQDDSDSILKILSQMAPQSQLMQSRMGEDPLQSALSSLVDDGTITSDQQTAIQDALDAVKSEMSKGNRSQRGRFECP